MNKMNKLILPLIIGFTCLVSCDNDPSKKYTITIYDYSSSSSYTEYAVSSTIKVKEGATLDYPSYPTRKTFQKFVGWTSDKEHKEFFDFNKPITSDVSLYANYTKKGERVLYVDYDDGVIRWGIHNEGDSIEKDKVPAPDTTQWHFSDWYLDKGFNKKATFPLTLDDDQYIYAYYIEKENPVTFHYNGGRFPTMSKVQMVKYNKCAKYFVPPKRAENEFECWCTDSELKNTFDFDTPITAATELWGKWKS